MGTSASKEEDSKFLQFLHYRGIFDVDVTKLTETQKSRIRKILAGDQDKSNLHIRSSVDETTFDSEFAKFMLKAQTTRLVTRRGIHT